MWKVVTDSDGHRWLVAPGDIWVASFAEIPTARCNDIVAALNATEASYWEELDWTFNPQEMVL